MGYADHRAAFREGRRPFSIARRRRGIGRVRALPVALACGSAHLPSTSDQQARDASSKAPLEQRVPPVGMPDRMAPSLRLTRAAFTAYFAIG
ncbi:hypothetical protein STH2405 [Symbiobacterium thermophilum IAM 14863]|uniref:Uncharacterized protein n=1 Tax=Symbiobacterium thermophilum (strain DSM 24528 / JCM 14929 / IAM 14863 / T) TaxID=292459 RepID=Q67LQ6_SYMTH|nr:hypothetical protein STH2405 [Symbiobacterium thermophilum IAM 14863]